MWDSGAVFSNETTNIEYAGAPLTADMDYTFTVTWTDISGAVSPAATSTFSMGLFPVELPKGAAVFLSGATSNENMLRAQFTVAGSPTRARLYIIGLGYYKSYINGELTDDHELGPFTTFERRLLYDAWDVSTQIKQGCNTIGVMLGAGWYAQHTVKTGPRSLFAVLSVTTSDGKRTLFPTALSGEPSSSLVFTSAVSPVVSDDVYLGEVTSTRCARVLHARIHVYTHGHIARMCAHIHAECAHTHAHIHRSTTPDWNSQAGALASSSLPLLGRLQLQQAMTPLPQVVP